ncbi:MAG: RNA 2',3'-cyclic phosphodiesterase [Candidatus Izemoplasmatales bacterium]
MRLFVGIPFSAAAIAAAEERADYVRKNSRRGNFTACGNLHLTLAFLGEIEDADVVARVLNQVRWTAFSIRIGGLGSFPSRGSSTVFAVCDGGTALSMLADAARTALRTAGVAYDPKPFAPHLTLVRESDLSAAAIERGSFPPAVVSVDRFVLFESLRSDGRLVYRPLATFPAEGVPR